MSILFAIVCTLTRWSYCKGCGERTDQQKTKAGWRCGCGYINK